MGDHGEQSQPIKPQLGLWDAVSIIVGIVIGSSIFQTAPIIFQNVSSPWMGMGVWLLGGVLSLIGAFCYAELATAYPRSGGDYVYLTRAFGPWVGFLFGWAQLAVILTGSTGVMANIFANYGVDLFHKTPAELQMMEFKLPDARQHELQTLKVLYAVGAVLLLTVMNILGIVLGKVTQNLLSAAKVLGLAGIVVAGFAWGQEGAASAEAWNVSLDVDKGFGVALILVLYAYGGWNDAAFVAADLKNRRNILRALILSTAGITLIYLAVNAAYLLGLGFDESRQFGPIAAKVLQKSPLGGAGFKVMCILVMISALGAINGLIFTGSRLYSTLGAEHSVFRILGQWNPRLGSPLKALLIQAVICVAMILSVGTTEGRGAIDWVLVKLGLEKMPWAKYYGGFDTLYAGTAPVFWVFFLLTGISFFVLRSKDPTIERPFRLRVPWYPLLPLIFCGMCIFGLNSAINYAEWVSLIGVVPLLLGVPLYFLSRRQVTDEPLPPPVVPAESPG